MFRAVDATELAIVKDSGKFSLQFGGVESKYFTKSLDDAPVVSSLLPAVLKKISAVQVAIEQARQAAKAVTSSSKF